MGVGLGFYSFQDCLPADKEEILILRTDHSDKFYSLNKAVISRNNSVQFITIYLEDGSSFIIETNLELITSRMLHKFFWMKLSEANHLITESINCAEQ